MLAAENGHTRSVQLLIAAGVDVAARTTFGYGPSGM
jgi:hypothetical protein